MNVKRLTAAYKNDAGKIVRGNAALVHNISANGGIKNVVDNAELMGFLKFAGLNILMYYCLKFEEFLDKPSKYQQIIDEQHK